MKDNQQIQRDVEETLNSLDGVKQATSNPYLFTRVRSRLEQERRSFWIGAFSFISRPAVAVSAIVLAIVINTAVFFEFQSETLQSSQENEQVFASEYNLSSDTIYEGTIDQQ